MTSVRPMTASHDCPTVYSPRWRCWAFRLDVRWYAQEVPGDTAATIFTTGCAKGGQAASDAPRPGRGAERRTPEEVGPVEAWSGLDEDSVRPLGKPGQQPDAMTTGPSVGQGQPSWLAGAWLQFAPTANRFGLGQISSLNSVGHHMPRYFRSVDAGVFVSISHPLEIAEQLIHEYYRFGLGGLSSDPLICRTNQLQLFLRSLVLFDLLR